MARSKTLHVVTRTHTVEQPNDSSVPVVDDQVDFALELSKSLGRNIRQGNNFRVVGFRVSIIPGVTGDVDMGYAVTARSYYAPTTYHSSEAWRQVFAQWRKQKLLAGKVGKHINFDDFEVAYTTDYKTSRTSTIVAGGMLDTNQESVTLYGASTQGDDFSLQDYYNSQNPVQSASRDPFTNGAIKDPKYTAKFPGGHFMTAGASMSAHVADLGSAQGDAYFGGSSSMDDQMFPSDNHINVLCGVSGYKAWILPPDTASQAADTMVITFEWLIEGWNTLMRKPKKKMKAPRRSYRKSRSRKPRRSYRRT
jgi:hypothetical protein